MRDHFILTRAAHLDALGAFRDFIARSCAHWNIPQDTVFALQLACDEAATNVIEHGYAGRNAGSLMLELRPGPKRITMVLSDFGRPFEPVETDAPNVDAMLHDQPSAGFGLYFIYSTMDEVNYYCDEQGNHLVLVKNLKKD